MCVFQPISFNHISEMARDKAKVANDH